jgi:hypothetical protein
MSFTIFVTQTTAYADEVLDNFYYLGGDRLPYDGNSLTAIDSTYDLGSSTYKWQNVYCNSIEISSITGNGMWMLIDKVVLSSTASTVDISGFEPMDEIYITMFHKDIDTNTAIYAQVNNAGTTSSYNGWGELVLYTSTGFIHSGTSASFRIVMSYATRQRTITAIYNFSTLYIFGQEGYNKGFKVNNMGSVVYDPTSTTEVSELMAVHDGGIGFQTISALNFYGSEVNQMATYTAFYIWGRKT